MQRGLDEDGCQHDDRLHTPPRKERAIRIAFRTIRRRASSRRPPAATTARMQPETGFPLTTPAR